MVSFARKFFGIIAIVAGVSLVLQLLAVLRSSPGCCLTRQQQITAEENGAAPLTAGFSSQTPDSNTTHEIPELQNWRKRRLAIGIPTVKRHDGNYILIMLDSMLNETSPDQLKKVVFIVLLADHINIAWKEYMETYLKKKYHTHIEAGSFIVLKTPLSLYRTMPKSVEKRKHYIDWRTKQNFDYAYLMRYSLRLSEYYMQMEDDVITKDDYYTAIMDFIRKYGNTKWVCLEFCYLGFIGKLFRSRDVVRLAEMILMFNSTVPQDYILSYFISMSGQEERIYRKPTLFQHFGLNSSLAGKIQQLEDEFYEYPEKELHGDNPNANVYTSLRIYHHLLPELAYRKRPGCFWSHAPPQRNDHFTVVFHQPQLVKGIAIVTGTKFHPDDIFYNAVVEASCIVSGTDECEDYKTIGRFNHGIANITETAIIKSMSQNGIICFRVMVIKKQTEGIVIKEIAVFIK